VCRKTNGEVNISHETTTVVVWICDGIKRGVYRVLVRKPEGRRPLGRPRRRWVDNNRTDLREVECGYMDWIGRAQDRDRWRTLVSEVMNLRVPCNAGNFLTSCKPVSCSRRTLHHGVSKYLIAKNNYMFRPKAAIFRLLQFCSKSVIYMPILRGDAEISSSLRVTVSLFSGKSNGQWQVGCRFMGRF